MSFKEINSYFDDNLQAGIWPASPIELQITLPSGNIVKSVKLPCDRLNLNHASGGNCNALNINMFFLKSSEII